MEFRHETACADCHANEANNQAEAQEVIDALRSRLTVLELAAATLCQAAGNYARKPSPRNVGELGEQIEAIRKLLGEQTP